MISIYTGKSYYVDVHSRRSYIITDVNVSPEMSGNSTFLVLDINLNFLSGSHAPYCVCIMREIHKPFSSFAEAMGLDLPS